MNILHLFILFLVGSIGLWMSVPVGLAYNFDPYIIALTIILGSTFSTFLVYFLGKWVRKHVASQKGERYLGKSKAKMYRYLNKYGVVGLGLLMPGVFGPMLGMAIGITIVSNTRGLLIWSLIGNILWSILLAGLGGLGLTIF